MKIRFMPSGPPDCRRAETPSRWLKATLAAVIALGMLPSGASATSWTPPQDLYGPASSPYGPAPMIAGAGSGIFATVWARQEVPTAFPVVASVRSSAGLWSPSVETSAGTLLNYRPTVAVNAAGQVAAAWIGGEGLSVAVRSSDGTWSAPQLFEGMPSLGGVRVVIDDAGLVTLAWGDYRGPNPPDALSVSRDASGAWSAPHRLTETAAAVGDMDVDANGTVTMLLQTSDGARVATKTATGAWSAPAAIASGDRWAAEAHLAVAPNGAAVVAWRVEETQLVAATRTPAGAWSAATQMSPAGTPVRDPQVAITDSGTATVGWVTTTQDAASGTFGNEILAASRPSGSAWGPTAQISRLGDHLDLAAGSAATTAVWQRSGRILSAIRSADGAWSTPVIVSGPEVGNSPPINDAPRIAADDRGEVSVVWSRFYGYDESGYQRVGISASSLVHPATSDPDPDDEEPTPDPGNDPKPQPPGVPPADEPSANPLSPSLESIAPRDPVGQPARKSKQGHTPTPRARLGSSRLKSGKPLIVRVSGVPNKARLVVLWKPSRGKTVRRTVRMSKKVARVAGPKIGRYKVTVSFKGRVLLRNRTVLVR